MQKSSKTNCQSEEMMSITRDHSILELKNSLLCFLRLRQQHGNSCICLYMFNITLHTQKYIMISSLNIFWIVKPAVHPTNEYSAMNVQVYAAWEVLRLYLHINRQRTLSSYWDGSFFTLLCYWSHCSIALRAQPHMGFSHFVLKGSPGSVFSGKGQHHDFV